MFILPSLNTYYIKKLQHMNQRYSTNR
uniref:Uncharacterized protein n=1 Tax=Arundo donax TaxID=35708 RepID=A0A0A9FGR0_ARUDO